MQQKLLFLLVLFIEVAYFCYPANSQGQKLASEVADMQSYPPNYREQIIMEAAAKRGLDPSAVLTLIRTLEPVIIKSKLPNGMIKTTTYNIDPYGTISRKTELRSNEPTNSAMTPNFLMHPRNPFLPQTSTTTPQTPLTTTTATTTTSTTNLTPLTTEKLPQNQQQKLPNKSKEDDSPTQYDSWPEFDFGSEEPDEEEIEDYENTTTPKSISTTVNFKISTTPPSKTTTISNKKKPSTKKGSKESMSTTTSLPSLEDFLRDQYESKSTTEPTEKESTPVITTTLPTEPTDDVTTTLSTESTTYWSESTIKSSSSTTTISPKNKSTAKSKSAKRPKKRKVSTTTANPKTDESTTDLSTPIDSSTSKQASSSTASPDVSTTSSNEKLFTTPADLTTFTDDNFSTTTTTSTIPITNPNLKIQPRFMSEDKNDPKTLKPELPTENDPFLFDVLKNLGFNPNNFPNGEGPTVTRTTTDSNGHVTTTTYKIHSRSYIPPVPPQTIFWPTADILPPPPPLPIVPTQIPVYPVVKLSPIDEFLSKCGLERKLFYRNKRHEVKRTFIDPDGQILTATFLLSRVQIQPLVSFY